MKFTGTVIAAYGLIVVLGGLIGYLKADSLPSLIMGSTSGALLFASGLGLYRGSILAFFTALSLSFSLGIFFSFRYYITVQMMPAGMMALLSFIILILLITSKGRPKKKK